MHLNESLAPGVGLATSSSETTSSEAVGSGDKRREWPTTKPASRRKKGREGIAQARRSGSFELTRGLLPLICPGLLGESPVSQSVRPEARSQTTYARLDIVDGQSACSKHPRFYIRARSAKASLSLSLSIAFLPLLPTGYFYRHFRRSLSPPRLWGSLAF